jgi:hypothetical protein
VAPGDIQMYRDVRLMLTPSVKLRANQIKRERSEPH